MASPLLMFQLTDGNAIDNIDVPAALRWTGRQGIFPLAYRGWATAGYNADEGRETAVIDASRFEIDIDDDNKPTEPATPGFGDATAAEANPDPAYAYIPAVQMVTIPGQPAPLASPVWVGNRPNLAASATTMRTSRLGADSLSLGEGSEGGAGRAVTRVSVTAPSAKLAVGFGPFGFSFGVAPSFGLVDYEDMNGDGYPDVITPDHITYTTQRGAYRAAATTPTGVAVTNQDLTFALSFGLGQGLVDIKANAKGNTNATKGGAAGKGGDAEDQSGGVEVGVGVDISWTSPNASDTVTDGSENPRESHPDEVGDASDAEGVPGSTAPIQLGLADVNGDGLPDRVYTNPDGVFALYNLGYRFALAPVKLTVGGFESQESYAGGLSLGFSTPYGDFSGGVALNWNVDLSRYAWNDVNGDGILDQIHKIDGQKPRVRFGTGSTMLPPVEFGTTPTATIEGVDAGQQVSLDRSNGLGGQFDFTVAIGPLCVVACYLIINPGASYQNSVSTTEIDLQDVNGDGFADALKTQNDDVLSVALNKQRDTNLLESVANPLGGTITLTYGRDGNTEAHPDSIWTLASVAVDDGRPGDGVDVRRTAYTYGGLKFDRIQRTSLGYATATETELDTAGVGVRETVHSYLNGNVFEAGLETSTLVNDLDNGGYIKGVRQTWVLRDVRGGADLANLEAVAALGYSIAPLLTQAVTEVGTGEPSGGVPGDNVGTKSTTTYTYDSLGNVRVEADLGEDDDPNDDVVAEFEFSRCDNDSSSMGCASDLPHDHESPIWDPNLCPTWVSLPVAITVTNGKTGADRVVYRHRDGRKEICNNASVTLLREFLADGSQAITELNYDPWGSYDRIVYPVGQNGRRYAVQYVWDLDGHSNIADVVEYDLGTGSYDADSNPATPPRSPVYRFLNTSLRPSDFVNGRSTAGLHSSALFDPIHNLVSSRTDANGVTIDYGYDPLGRLESVSSPFPQDTQPLVKYDYFVLPDDPHAVAENLDRRHPGDAIRTAAFADGIGRVVQTQQDASLFTAAGQSAATGVIVSGATIFDYLGRPEKQYNPTRSTQPFGVFETASPADPADPHTETVYDLWDMANEITEPGNRVTEISYDYGQVNPTNLNDPVVYKTTETAPGGRQTVTYADFRDVVRAVDDIPTGGAPHQLTLYQSDGMGQLLKMTDPSGFVTSHVYDQMGRRTSTTTPDGGRVDFEYDLDGQQIRKVTPNLRAKGQDIRYQYDLHRLMKVDYPGVADDVTYVYGAMGAPDFGAGQVVRSEDGSQIERNRYDQAGNIVEQATTMKLHAWTPAADQSKFTWTTKWTYDALGRLLDLTYPDTEKLDYGYDAGGLVNSIVGNEEGFENVLVGYDSLGKPIYQRVPRTWHYEYLRDRQYDEFLRRRYDVLGNGATTELTFDPNTQYLVRLQTISPNRDVKGQGAGYKEIQDLAYGYYLNGNVKTYDNNLPAPVTNLFTGPTHQDYTYDPYERIETANATWGQAPDKLRHYSLTMKYDTRGNVTSKDQLDQIRNGKKELTQTETTYKYTRSFGQPAPHQATAVGTDKYFYDLDGNLLGLKDAKGKWIRQMTWDAADRMRTVTDGPSLTDYTYDDSGQRAIERGPAGETATVNPWVTVRNTTEIYKHIWAGNDRIGTQRDDGGNLELKQYFLHKDLQGSTNVVTDIFGNTFQHHEYFATGEVWVDEKSTVFRTPYQFGGGYVDEVREITNFGSRWYDQNRDLFYAPDPVLVDDPMAIVGTPSLQAAYAYAGNNGVNNVDPTGNQFTRAQAKAFIKANMKEARAQVANDPALRARIEQNLQTRLPRSLVRLSLDIESADLHQKRFKMLDDIATPFVEINVSTGEVQLSAGLFKQWPVRKGKQQDDGGNAGTKQQDATNGNGGPSSNAAPTKASADQSPATPPRPKTPAPTDGGKGTPSTPAKKPPKPLPKRPAPGSQ